jgi:RNA recognition motif-containing protein
MAFHLLFYILRIFRFAFFSLDVHTSSLKIPFLNLNYKKVFRYNSLLRTSLENIMSTKIYVGNLGYTVADNTLSEKFAQFGTVQSAKVIMDRDTNRSKGFGFVEMSTSAEAAKAITSLNGTDFGGRQMNVTEAKPMVPRDNKRY